MKQRIIWLIDSLKPGGAEQLMPSLLKEFDNDSYEIRVCVLQVRKGNPIAVELGEQGIPVDLVLVRNLRNPINLFHVLQYFKKLSPILIHTQLEFADTLGNLAAKIIHIPSVSTLHTLEVPKKRKFAFFRLKLKWFVLRYFCDTIIAVSEITRKHHIKFGKLPPQKTKTIYNGIQLSRFQKRNESQLDEIRQGLKLKTNQTVVTTVAVLREPKGIQYMIRAMPEILKHKPDLTYLIVGDGVYADSLLDLVTVLGLQGNVIFTGRRTDIPDILAVSDLFVLPSLGDALPTVLIEALAAQTPIIATKVGGIPEIIENDVNGMLVPPADSDRLADACIKLIQDQELSHQFTVNGLEIAKRRFDVKVQVEQLQNLYKDLIKQYEQ